jgi:beta-lactam-binding protein with PASTA domain
MTGCRTTLFARAAVAAPVLALSLAVAPMASADTGPDKMPDVKGKSLTDAYEALNYDTGITFEDGRGAGRHVLLPWAWRVCSQKPAAGSSLKDMRISLVVVKRGEKCP